MELWEQVNKQRFDVYGEMMREIRKMIISTIKQSGKPDGLTLFEIQVAVNVSGFTNDGVGKGILDLTDDGSITRTTIHHPPSRSLDHYMISKKKLRL